MTLRKNCLSLFCPSLFKCSPRSLLAYNSSLTFPQCVNGLYVHINLKFWLLLIFFDKYALTSLIIGSVIEWSFGLGIIADMIILIPGFSFLQIAIKLPKSEMMALKEALLSISFVPTWNMTTSKSFNTALGSFPPLHSLFVNLAMVSPGNGWTLHPSIPDIFLAIESQMIVTLLTPVSINWTFISICLHWKPSK